MSKKTTEAKREKQALKKQPSELTDEQLDGAVGGTAVITSGSSDGTKTEPGGVALQQAFGFLSGSAAGGSTSR